MAKSPVASMTIRGAVAGVPAAWKRIASAVVLLPLFVWVTTSAAAWMFQALVVAASFLACRELARMYERTERPINSWLCVGVGTALTASFAVVLYAIGDDDGAPLRWAPTPELVLVVGVLLILSAPLWTPGRPVVASTANTLFGAVYVGWLLGYAVWLHARPEGSGLVLFLVGVTWAGESAAYVAGSTFGRRQIAPVLSPRKTVEGAVAQIVVSVAAALGLGIWLVPGCGVAGAVGAGLVLGVIGQAGDLAESAIKRSIGTKDTGSLIPGHGGVLDRIDSLLFNAPALYFYTLYAWCRA